MKFWKIIVFMMVLSGCTTLELPYEIRQILNRLNPEFKQNHVKLGDPVFIRIFKEDNILELWMRGEDSNRYTLIKTYPICKWSGSLGPKFREGDHQAPEGFYATNLQNLKPDSQYHLAFNIQFPNAYDRSQGRTGSFIMVHGNCVSEGCYAMTDEIIEEIYVVTERALIAGQNEIPIHIFPFPMTNDRMFMEFTSPHYDFWRNLQEGYEYFETHGTPPKWIAENGRYRFY